MGGMKLLSGLDRFLLTSSLGKTLFGPVVSTGAAVLLGLSFEHQPLTVQLVRLTLLLLVLSATWYGVRRSELERAASEARSRNLEARFEALIDEATNTIIERAERAEEAAIGALRSSLCGLEAQAASADLAAATTARSYLALLEQEGLTASLAEPHDGGSDA
jgi:ABC-type transport system involved in cytochrome bd biosynthesis fused ATPase/permease subunit